MSRLRRLLDKLKLSRLTGARGEITRGGVYGLAFRLGETVLALAVFTLLARALGPAGMGIFAIATAVTAILGIPAQAGLPTLVAREAAIARARGEWGRLRGVLTFASVAAAAMALLVGLVTLTVMQFWRPALSGEQATTLLYAVVLVPIVALANIRNAALLALGRVVQAQAPEALLRPGLTLILVVIALAAAPGWISPPRAMLLQIVAAATTFIVGAVLLLRALPPEVRQAKPILTPRAWIVSAIPLSMTAGLRVAQPNLALLFLGWLATTEQAGLFRVGQRGSDFAALPISVLMTVSGVYLARFQALGEKTRLQTLATRLAQVGFACAVLALAAFALLGPALLGFLFGPAFRDSYGPLLILTGAQALSAFFGANASLMNMGGEERVVTAAFAAGVLAQTVASVALIPSLGAAGAAAGMAVSFLVWNLILWQAARRRFGVRTTAAGF